MNRTILYRIAFGCIFFAWSMIVYGMASMMNEVFGMLAGVTVVALFSGLTLYLILDSTKSD